MNFISTTWRDIQFTTVFNEFVERKAIMAWWGRNKDEQPQPNDPEQLSPELIARYNEVLLDGLSDGDMMNRVKNDRVRNPSGKDPREYLTVEEVMRLKKEIDNGV